MLFRNSGCVISYGVKKNVADDRCGVGERCLIDTAHFCAMEIMWLARGSGGDFLDVMPVAGRSGANPDAMTIH